MSSTYPYIARATVKYKSPHATDLSFAKGETIRVTGVSDEDEDWMLGESMDGERKGGFPRDFVEQVEEEQSEAAMPASVPAVAAPARVPTAQPEEEEEQEITKAEIPVAAQEPERPAVQPPSQPLPEAEAIPGSFNPEPVKEELKEEAPAEPVAAPAAVAAPVSTPAPVPASTPIKSTPAPDTPAQSGDAPEPSKLSFKDRLAAFNKPKPTPGSPGSDGRPGPPPLKPKPAGGLTWSQRQKLREEEEKKAREAGGGEVSATAQQAQPTPAPVSVSAATVSTSTEQATNDEKSGMSASDAKASIGLSLKERMAALNNTQAFGGSPAAPKPEDTAEAAEKKPTKTWKRPEVEEGAPLAIPGQMPMPVRSASNRSIEGAGSGDAERPGDEQAEGTHTGEGEGGEEMDEQQKEKERRAAIAARMAKLGGRGMFGGPPPALGPKPGAAKRPSIEVEPPATEADQGAPASAPVEPAPPIAESQPVSPAAATAPGGGIAMPAIPKRAAGPRRRGGGAAPAGPSRSNSQAPEQPVSSPVAESGAQLARDEPLAVGAVADQARRDASGDQDKALEEQMGGGPAGIKGAEAAGIALHTPPPQVQQQTQQQEQRDQATVGEDVAGQDLARKAEGPVLVGAEGDADAEYRGGLSDVVLGGGSAGVSRMPPPPAPPGGFDSEDEQEDDNDDEAGDDLLRQAKSGQMHVEPSRIDVEEGLPRQPEEEEHIASPTSPVAFAPLHSPANESPDLPKRGVASPVPQAGSTSAGLASLGLPRDEIELKHEQDAAEAEDEDEDEGDAPPPPPRSDRPADKPSGPRPMPNPPVLGQTAEPEQPAPGDITRTELPEQGDLGAEEEDGDEEQDAPPPPPPRRQESVGGPAQVGLALPQDQPGVEPRQAVSPPAIVTEEPKMMAPADDEATRRQNIAARMAKLGGIKLGGPPLGGFNARQGSNNSDAGPMSPTEGQQSPRSPLAEVPRSPIGSAVPTLPADQTVDDNDESEEAAALRRRATLARLQAGGHLGGFNMFSRNVEPQSPTVETAETGPVTAGGVENVDERNLQPEYEDDVPESAAPLAVQEVDAQDEDRDVSEDEDVPPPPPRRPANMVSPPQSPIAEVPTSPSFEQPRTLADPGLLQSPPPSGLAPPIPISTTNLSAEPAAMLSAQEREEDNDAMGPPPPPRPTEIVTAPTHQRSDSRASRISIGSRSSTGGVPTSPTTPRRTSMQAGRPGYNELQQASSAFGTKVYRAAQKLADTGRRQSIGDGSSRAFVWAALADAGIDANAGFGTLIWEQEGSTQHKRYDDIRVGDVVVLHDAKLKGKKGLISYQQQVGSVEEPMFCICAETESKKNKCKVWQVERGHITTESYRLEDLQSGLVRVFRPMTQ